MTNELMGQFNMKGAGKSLHLRPLQSANLLQVDKCLTHWIVKTVTNAFLDSYLADYYTAMMLRSFLLVKEPCT